MRKLKRSMCIILSALMLVTSLDLSGFTSLRAEASEYGYEEVYADTFFVAENDVSANDASNSGSEDLDAGVADDVSSNDSGDAGSEDENGVEPDSEIDIEPDVSANDSDKIDVSPAIPTSEGGCSEVIDVSEFVVQDGGFLPENYYEVYEAVQIEGDGWGYVELPRFEATESQKSGARAALANAMAAGLSSVDISGYNISTSEVLGIFVDVLNEHPELFYVNRQFYYYYWGGTVTDVCLSYVYTGSTLTQKKKLFNDAVNQFMLGVQPGWSDLEKMLYLNSYLCQLCEYDKNYQNSKANPNRYNAYGVLVDKVAVCNGYALAVKLLCSKMGISSTMVTSVNINHAWNIVKVDGSLYYIDTTWNDPFGAPVGHAGHSYFLKSKDAFSGHGNTTSNDWVVQSGWSKYSVSSTKYDSGNVWDSSIYGITYNDDDGCWYYTIPYTGMKRAYYTSLGQTLKEDTGFSFAGSAYTYSGIGANGGELYFNDGYKIYSYEPYTKKLTTILDLTNSMSSSQNLYDVAIIGNYLKYCYKTGPYELTEVAKTVLISATVTFDTNGGDTPTFTKKYRIGQAFDSLPLPDKTGYEFVGWYTAKTGGTEITTASTMSFSADTTIYARWEAKKYTVTFNRNCMDSSCRLEFSEREYTYDSEFGVFPTVTRTGYTFKGWCTGMMVGVTYTEKDKMRFAENRTLYALWEPTPYTVNLDPQGGEVNPSSVTVRYLDEFGVIPKPAKKNYKFIGWYDGTDSSARLISDGETASTIQKTTAEDQTLYARWELKYRVYAPLFETYDGHLYQNGDELKKGERVYISSQTNGARIYYTTDGTVPTEDPEHLYEDGIVITEAVTLTAVAVLEDHMNSMICQISFTVEDESEEWGSLGESENTEDLDYIKAEIADNRDDITDSTQVKATDVPKELWVAGVKDYDYTGTAITQTDANGVDTMKVYWGTTLLTKNTDYTVKYANNVKAGTATVTITGKGNYAGTIAVDYKINARSLEASDAHCTDIKLAFNNKVQKGVPVVTYDYSTVVNGQNTTKTLTLKNGTDYTIEYPCTNVKDKNTYDANAFKAANSADYYPNGYEIKITGKGNYTGTLVIHEFIYADTVNVSSLVYSLKATPYNFGAWCFPGDGSLIKKGKVALEETEFKIAKDAAEAQEFLDAADANTSYSIIVYYENNIEIGTAKATYVGIPAKGYAGSVTKTFAITGSKLTTVSFAPDLVKTYSWEKDEITGTGKKIEPVNPVGDDSASLYVMKNKVRVKNLAGIEASEYNRVLNSGSDGEKALLRMYDYTYEYVGDTTNVGSVKIVFTGINAYTGSVTKTYKIAGKSIAKYVVRGINASYVYTGESITMSDDIRVFIPATKTTPEQELEAGKDFVVGVYTKNTNVGIATVEIKGINGYTGSIKKNFKITAYNLNNASIKVNDDNPLGRFKYTKGGVKPSIELSDSQTGEKVILTLGKDYTVSYKNNNAANDGSNPRTVPTVTITGKGNYVGTLSRTFVITKCGIQDSVQKKSFTANDCVYSAKAGVCNSAITVIDEATGAKLVAGTDYIAPTIANGSIYYAKDCVVKQVVNKKTVTKVRTEGEVVAKNDILPVGAELRAVIKTIDKPE